MTELMDKLPVADVMVIIELPSVKLGLVTLPGVEVGFRYT